MKVEAGLLSLNGRLPKVAKSCQKWLNCGRLLKIIVGLLSFAENKENLHSRINRILSPKYPQLQSIASSHHVHLIYKNLLKITPLAERFTKEHGINNVQSTMQSTMQLPLAPAPTPYGHMAALADGHLAALVDGHMALADRHMAALADGHVAARATDIWRPEPTPADALVAHILVTA